MEGNYIVTFGNQPSGRVEVIRQGLYYRFRCRCQLSGDVICQLIMICGDRRERIGIVVPMDDGFGLDTKLPAKRFSFTKPLFSLIPKTEAVQGKFVPIYPEEPFAYIEQLKDAFLVRKYGQAGILVK